MEKDELMQQMLEKVYRQVQLPMAIVDHHGERMAVMPNPLLRIINAIDPADYSKTELENGVFRNGWSFFGGQEEGLDSFMVAIYGPLEACSLAGKMSVLLAAQCLKLEDHIEQSTIIKDLILGKIHAEEAKVYARNKGIDLYRDRCVYLVETDPESDPEADAAAMDILRNLFPDDNQYFIFSPELHRILLILELREGEADATGEILSTAQMIFDMLSSEAELKVCIAVGSVAHTIEELIDSFQEAKKAITIGKIFYPEKIIHDSKSQGIGRIIYQMNAQMCHQFLNQNVRGIRVDQMDASTLEMITAFFDNNLTLSETARQLYSHRNTLVYRLDKLQRQTGLDIRVFEDAFTFKLAMMVSKYLDHLE